MRAPLSILIVDENELIRSLISRVLMRRFEAALVEQCADADTARHAVRTSPLTVIVAGPARHAGSHRRFLAELRELNADVPILALSAEMDHATTAAAGASCLIDPQNWIRVPDVVAAIVRWSVRHGDTSEIEFIASA